MLIRDFPRQVLRLHAWLIIPVLAMYIMTLQNNADPDLWGRLAVGGDIIRHHHFPYLDSFSFTAHQQPWFDHEWGSGVIFYWLFCMFGSLGLFWFKMALALLTVGVIFQLDRLRTHHEQAPNSSITGFLLNLYLLLPLIVPGYSTTIRCQHFSFLFFALFFWLLERYRLTQQWGSLIALPLIMLLWANVHGGFLLGLMLLAIYSAWLFFQPDRRAVMPVLVTLLLCAAITLINPYGPAYYAYLFKAWLLPRADISEWKNVFQAASLIFSIPYTLLFLLYTGLATRRWWRQTPRSFPAAPLLLAALGLEGWLHIKLSPFFVLTALAIGDRLGLPPWPPIRLTPVMREKIQDIGLVLCPVALAIAVLVINVPLWIGPDSPVVVPVSRSKKQWRLVAYPVGAMRYMQGNHLSGNLWCPFDWGEFLIWNLSPHVLVSIDGRYEEVYPNRLMREHLDFYKRFDLRIPAKYNANLLLIPTEQLKKATPHMAQHPEWVLLYQDKVASLYALHHPLQAPTMGQIPAKPATLDEFL